MAKYKELKMAIDEPNLRDLRVAFGKVPERSDETMTFAEAIDRAIAFLSAGSLGRDRER
ncbi:MAG: hypothetical protein ABIS18_00930 [Actinomycetota bacterium]